MDRSTDRRLLLASLAASPLLAPMAGRAAAPMTELPSAWTAAERTPIWPGPAPGDADFRSKSLRPTWPAVFLRNTRTPALHIFRPERSNGRGVLVMPGGGYAFVSIANEGVDVAARLCPMGYTVFVLQYRLPAEGWRPRADVPLQDAQRAMRVIKARALDDGLDATRLCAIGFSAGGHLAASLATGFDERVYPPVDAIDRLSARPAAAALIYPVISLEADITNAATRQNLLGDTPDAVLIARRSPDLHLTADTPPLFLVHAGDDPSVPMENSVRMFDAARKARVPVEAHFLREGGHGFGIGVKGTPSSLWIELWGLWADRTLAG